MKNNVLERVKLYLEDENLNSQGYQADVNCKIEFNGFRLTPLLLAIQVYQPKWNLDVIKCLLANYADVNC